MGKLGAAITVGAVHFYRDCDFQYLPLAHLQGLRFSTFAFHLDAVTDHADVPDSLSTPDSPYKFLMQVATSRSWLPPRSMG